MFLAVKYELKMSITQVSKLSTQEKSDRIDSINQIRHLQSPGVGRCKEDHLLTFYTSATGISFVSICELKSYFKGALFFYRPVNTN